MPAVASEVPPEPPAEMMPPMSRWRPIQASKASAMAADGLAAVIAEHGALARADGRSRPRAASRPRSTACPRSRGRRCGCAGRASRRRSRMNLSSRPLVSKVPTTSARCPRRSAANVRRRSGAAALPSRPARGAAWSTRHTAADLLVGQRPAVRHRGRGAVDAGLPAWRRRRRRARSGTPRRRARSRLRASAGVTTASGSSAWRPTPSSRCCRSRSAASTAAGMRRLICPLTMMPTVSATRVATPMFCSITSTAMSPSRPSVDQHVGDLVDDDRAPGPRSARP